MLPGFLLDVHESDLVKERHHKLLRAITMAEEVMKIYRPNQRGTKWSLYIAGVAQAV
jgi:hypothetical protein